MDLNGMPSPPADPTDHSCSLLTSPDALTLEDMAAFTGGVPTAAYPSPAASGYDMAGSSASSSTNMGTVSPRDLFVRELPSAPNSTAFTNLTSPSLYNGSPDFDGFDVSPNFGHNDFDIGTGSADAWFPLFPQDNTITDAALVAIDQSPLVQNLDIEPVAQPRRKLGASPTSMSHGRHSSVSGVNSRRRDKPLPPIVIDDPQDNVAMKRARNTLAARKSRERKAQKMEDLEDKIAKLEEERDHWKRIALSRGA
ncbi:general control protein GCN4 [Microdochium nivale]|nr:general control protein GCN4 [Microdochium nivale]